MKTIVFLFTAHCSLFTARCGRFICLVLLVLGWTAAAAAMSRVPHSPERSMPTFGPSHAEAGSPSQQQASVRHAKGFTLEYHDTYKKVQVLSPWRNARDTFTYILVPHGGTPPPELDGATVVEIPVRRIVLISTSQLAYLAALQAEQALVGFAGCGRVNAPAVVEKIRRGEVVEVGVGNSGMVRNLNMEHLYALQPDVVMVYATGIAEYDHHPKLIEGGFKTLIAADYMEPTPLGRAEWIKFMAAFFDKDAEAERIFGAIEDRYAALAERARDAARRPTVFCGMTYQDVWHMPGGDSYTARFLADAGADYLWRDDPTRGSMPLSMESVIERAGNADFWLDTGTCRSLSELAGADTRCTGFRPFQTGQVYNNNAKVGPGGGNDFWETGIIRPDLVLADLISIFHPDLLPSHRRIWYWRLPAQEGAGP